MTKQFTAYCILKLASEKKISLNDKINKYLPDFNPRVAGMVTIRHIFSNRTGIDLEDLVREINKILKIDNFSFVKLESLIS